jgi:glycosyltransferase involved in cell wall biosynthesis
MPSFSSNKPIRVAIVARNASTRFGGEAILPWHYFRLLRRRGVEAHLVVHERTRTELLELLPQEAPRMHFVPDLPLHRALHRLGTPLPTRLAYYSVDQGIAVSTSLAQRELVQQLVRRRGIDVVHEVTPVSPKEPSFMFGLDVPVVIGPMNGGMDFPPGFARDKHPLERVLLGAGQHLVDTLNRAIPGKCEAAMLLVANARTRAALPACAARRVLEISENAVDLSLFTPRERPAPEGAAPRFAFVGRLVDVKRVDLLLEALARCPPSYELVVIGDGPLRAPLQARTHELRLGDRVRVLGMLSQARCSEHLLACQALVLPSIHECGGAVVLEAMAMGLPVIAADWGGPSDYLDASTGILVPPTSPEALVQGIAAAMERLGSSRELCLHLGSAGRARVEQQYDWERKIDRILEVYAQVTATPQAPEPTRASQTELVLS